MITAKSVNGKKIGFRKVIVFENNENAHQLRLGRLDSIQKFLTAV